MTHTCTTGSCTTPNPPVSAGELVGCVVECAVLQVGLVAVEGLARRSGEAAAGGLFTSG